jgi:hypothetical protein
MAASQRPGGSHPPPAGRGRAAVDRRPLPEDGDPIWVVVLTGSNPFHEIRVAGTIVTVTNNLGNSLVIDLDDRDFAW